MSFSYLTRGWVETDLPRRLSQTGAKSASKAWPRGWQARDVMTVRVAADPPLNFAYIGLSPENRGSASWHARCKEPRHTKGEQANARNQRKPSPVDETEERSHRQSET